MPATHSSGVDADLASLDRRDLVLRRGEHPTARPTRGRPRSAGPGRPGHAGPRRSQRDHGSERRRGGPSDRPTRRQPSTIPIRRWRPRAPATSSGEPEDRDQHERHDEAAGDGPDGVRAEQRSRSSPACPASSGSSADDAGKRDAEHDRHGQDRQHGGAQRAPRMASTGRAGVGSRGAIRTRTSPARASAAARDLAAGQQPQRIADPRPDRREDERAQREPDEERRQDGREDVRRVAGTRRPAIESGDLVSPSDVSPETNATARASRGARAGWRRRPSRPAARQRAWRGRASSEPERREAGGRGACRPRRPERPGQPQQLDQHEARQRGPGDRADRVGRRSAG